MYQNSLKLVEQVFPKNRPQGKYLPHIGSMEVQDTPKFLDSCQANLTTTNAWKHDKPVTMYLLL